jgi:hypothetical protein
MSDELPTETNSAPPAYEPVARTISSPPEEPKKKARATIRQQRGQHPATSSRSASTGRSSGPRLNQSTVATAI